MDDRRLVRELIAALRLERRVVMSLAGELADMQLRYGTCTSAQRVGEGPGAVEVMVTEHNGRSLRTEVRDANIALAVSGYTAHLKKKGVAYNLTKTIIPGVAEELGIPVSTIKKARHRTAKRISRL